MLEQRNFEDLQDSRPGGAGLDTPGLNECSSMVDSRVLRMFDECDTTVLQN